jgi:hypothetical protein
MTTATKIIMTLSRESKDLTVPSNQKNPPMGYR